MSKKKLLLLGSLVTFAGAMFSIYLGSLPMFLLNLILSAACYFRATQKNGLSK